MVVNYYTITIQVRYRNRSILYAVGWLAANLTVRFRYFNTLLLTCEGNNAHVKC